MVSPPSDVEALWYPHVDHAEGCAVDQDGVIWCGGEDGQVYRGRLGELPTTVAVLPGRVLGMVTDAVGNLYCATESESAIWRVTPDGDAEILCAEIDGRPLSLPNHPAFLPDGRLLFTDSGGWLDNDGFIAAIRADGFVEIVDRTACGFPNGIFVEPDGVTVLVVESTLPGIVRLHVTDDGRLVGREICVALPGVIPDGVLLDSAGSLIVTCFAPDALLLVEGVEVTILREDPTRFVLHSPTNAAFLPDSRFVVVANYGERHLAVFEHVRPGSVVFRPVFDWAPITRLSTHTSS